MRLTSLKASSVRGIPRNWPVLPIGNRGLVVFGQNGVGKSSIIDAIEYALSGKTTLYPVNRQNVTWENGAPHVRDGAFDISVEMAGSKKSYALTAEGYPHDTTDDDKAWIDAARRASFVLRRHMLLRFILGEPRHRYALLEPFMNLNAYQATEEALRDLKEELESAHAGAATTMRELEGPLRQAFGLGPDEVVVEAVLVNRVNALLRELSVEEIGEREDLETRASEIARQLGGMEEPARLAALGALKNEVRHLGLAGDLKGLLGSVIEAAEALEREVEARTDAILTDLLVRGREAIEAASLTTCPICEQDIDRDAVMARLTERIDADARITAGRKLIRERRITLLDHLRPLVQGMGHFIENWRRIVDVPLPEEYGQTERILRELETAVADENAQGRIRELEPRLDACVASHDGVTGILDGIIVKEGGGERRGQLVRADMLIKAVMTEWPTYEAAARKTKRLGRLKKTVDRLYDHAVQARRDTVSVMVNDVDATANDFYEKVHPGEDIATSRLQVRDVGQGSLILSSIFHGTEENPLLHYSESHLDTLGLCYFLALRRQEAETESRFKVLVLDDVMHSVDAVHRSRIAELLKAEFSEHQIVITTHDIHFFDALRREFGNAGYQYVRITNWDLERGPVLSDPLTDFDRIMVAGEREKLGSETLASAGGRFFEWLLREATEALAVAVPARFKRKHDIGNLWPPLASKLKRQEGFIAAHGLLVDELERNGWVRNACGAHYSDAPASPTEEEVRRFAEDLASLYAALHCRDCRKIVERQRNGDWRCQCGHLIYPAKAPASRRDA